MGELDRFYAKYKADLDDPLVKAKFIEEQNAIYERVAELSQRQKISLKQHTLSSAYHEFFADLLPVLYFEDPKVMYRILLDPMMKEDEQWTRYRNRNFRKPYRKTELLRWERRMKSDLGENPYVALAPARGEIWKTISQRVKSKSLNKSKFISSVFGILRKNYEQIARDLAAGIETDWRKVNQQLSDAFKGLDLNP
jgi:hypothetical protein